MAYTRNSGTPAVIDAHKALESFADFMKSQGSSVTITSSPWLAGKCVVVVGVANAELRTFHLNSFTPANAFAAISVIKKIILDSAISSKRNYRIHSDYVHVSKPKQRLVPRLMAVIRKAVRFNVFARV